jgi:hypothetical protein
MENLHREPKLSGGFAELAKKGIRIKDYKEDIPRPRRNWNIDGF